MAVETRQPLNPFRCIEDPEFIQDLISLKVITLGDLNPERWELKPSSVKVMTKARRLIELAAQEPGTIVPNDRLITEVYGNDTLENRKLLRSVITDARNKIKDKTALTRVFGIGVGVGIERFEITPRTLAFLYRAWQDFGSFVSIDELSYAVYGDNDKNSLGDTRVNSRNLAQLYLRGTDAQLEGAYIGDRHFVRLSDSKFLPRYANAKRYIEYPGFPKHLQPTFQNWLINRLRLPTPVGEEQLALKLPPDLWTYGRHIFNKEERKIIEMLRKYPVYVVPSEEMAAHVLEEPLPDNWNEIMQSHASRIRRKLRPGVSIHRFEELGWSIGISNLGVGKLRLMALSELWENFNNGVPVKNLAKRLYGNAKGANPENTRAIVDMLKSDLEPTDYSVAYLYSLLKEESDFTPALIANQNIITKTAA